MTQQVQHLRNTSSSRLRRLAIAILSSAGILAAGSFGEFTGPCSSQPIALTADSQFLGVVNPDNNSVSFFDVRLNSERKILEVSVQTEPNGIILTPDGSKAYVANTVSGTVTVLNLNLKNGIVLPGTRHIRVGTEPYGLCLTPNASKLYVSNARSNSISVIDTTLDSVERTISNVGFEPRGLAITNNGDAYDDDETVYVTQFLALPASGKTDGADDSKVGRVTMISTGTDTVQGEIVLNPLRDTGFKALGDALARVAPGTTATFVTGAYPNQLNNIAIKGNFAYVPNTGASPNGPLRFDVNTQSLLSVINLPASTDAGKTINMHQAVASQTGTPKLFVTQPWAMAFENDTQNAWVLSAASDVAFKVSVQPANGQPTVELNPSDPSRVFQLKTGKNPRGIVINSDDTRAYVMNYVSRSVTVLNLVNGSVQNTLQSAALPPTSTMADTIHVGKELYFSSTGEFDNGVRNRMSNNGWGACSTCHPFGLSDNVVWIFDTGPRRTIPQHTDFDQTDPARNFQRLLNWSAVRDEEEDFELNIRNVSGGQGLIVLADGTTQDPNVANFLPLASGNRNQLKVRGVGAWDALKTFVQFGIRAPISPVSASENTVAAGRSRFISANCQSCHGGPQWTSSRLTYTPPPAAAQVVNGQIISELRKVGTFDPAFFNEVRQNAAAPLGADGFVPPSLLSLFAFPQTFFHNGSADSLDAVMNNVTHRSAGTGGVDTLANATDRERVIRFLLSIDAGTPPI